MAGCKWSSYGPVSGTHLSQTGGIYSRLVAAAFEATLKRVHSQVIVVPYEVTQNDRQEKFSICCLLALLKGGHEVIGQNQHERVNEHLQYTGANIKTECCA